MTTKDSDVKNINFTLKWINEMTEIRTSILYIYNIMFYQVT
jgi:hypothetical protein